MDASHRLAELRNLLMHAEARLREQRVREKSGMLHTRPQAEIAVTCLREELLRLAREEQRKSESHRYWRIQGGDGG